MNDYLAEAIRTTRDLFVQLLIEKSWCKARQVGQVLEILVNVEKQGEIEVRPTAARRMTVTEQASYEAAMKDPGNPIRR